jgi:hypothetical protein
MSACSFCHSDSGIVLMKFAMSGLNIMKGSAAGDGPMLISLKCGTSTDTGAGGAVVSCAPPGCPADAVTTSIDELTTEPEWEDVPVVLCVAPNVANASAGALFARAGACGCSEG